MSAAADLPADADFPDASRAVAALDFGRAAEADIEAVMVRLGSSGTAALPALNDLYASPDPERRWWAVRALAESPAPQAGALLVLALDDPDINVRQCATAGLRQRPQAAAVPALLICLGSPNSLLRRLAGDALAALGAPAVDALVETLQHGPEERRGQAARALALTGDTRSIPALFAALDDPSTFVAYWANEGLDRLGVGMMFFKPAG